MLTDWRYTRCIDLYWTTDSRNCGSGKLLKLSARRYDYRQSSKPLSPHTTTCSFFSILFRRSHTRR